MIDRGARAEAAAIGELSLFAAIPEDQLSRIALHVHRATFPAGTFLAGPELPADNVYFIIEGSVKDRLVTKDGNEVTMALFGAGDTIGEATLVSRRGGSTSVVTRQETSLLWIERADFIHCLSFCRTLNHNLLRHLSDRLRRANDQILSLVTLDVTGRVARQILDLAQRFGQVSPGEGIRVALPVTQGEIAEMVAATRERVNQVMVRMRRLGVFSMSAEHCMTVHRPEALAALLRKTPTSRTPRTGKTAPRGVARRSDVQEPPPAAAA